MGQRARPHDIGARLRVGRIGHSGRCLVDDSFEQPFGHTVGGRTVVGGGEIALHDMRHHVGNATRHLKRRQRECNLRVEDGETRAQCHVGAQRYLLHVALTGNHRVARAFASGGRNSEHHAHRQCLLHHGSTLVEIPEIAIVDHTAGYSLGRVDSATAAHGYHSVDAFATAYLYTFIHTVICRIGVNPRKFQRGNPSRLNRRQHPVEQPRTACRTVARHHQYLLNTHRSCQLPHLFLYPAAKHIPRRRTIRKIYHNNQITNSQTIIYILYILFRLKIAHLSTHKYTKNIGEKTQRFLSDIYT